MKKFNKKVMFDIDGVISNIESTIDAFRKFTGKNISTEEVYDYNLRKVFGIDREDMSKLFPDALPDIILKEELSKNIFNLLDYFKNIYCGGNNKIYILTARDKHLEKNTLMKFKEHGIIDGVHFDYIEHGCIPKEEYIIKHKIDAVIEDRGETLVDLKEKYGYNCDMYLMDRPYNRSIDKKYITRITEDTELNI